MIVKDGELLIYRSFEKNQFTVLLNGWTANVKIKKY